MSNYWSLWCLDCSEESQMGDYFNHGEQQLLELWEFREPIAATHKIPVLIRMEHNNCGLVDVEFFVKHKDHNVKPRDEYHRLSGNCAKHINGCPTCDGQVVCKLLENHEGECQYKRRY